MPQTTSAYYLPSGEWAEHSVRLFVLVILPLSAAWGYGYAHAIHVAPIQFFKIFFMVLVLVLMSMVNGSLLVKRGHIRNLKIARIFGVLSAMVFLYVYWVVWLDLAFGSHDELRAHPAATAYLEASPHWTLLLIRPDLLWPLVVAVFETGTWGFFNFDGDRILTGTPLAVLWLAEISLFVSALPDNFTKYVRKPYCEAVGDWFEEGELNALQFVADVPGWKQKLESGDYSDLVSMQRVSDHEAHSKLTLYYPPNYSPDDRSDGNWVQKTKAVARREPEYYITAINRTPVGKASSPSRQSWKEEDLVEVVRLSPEAGKQLKKLLRKE
jgi:hypothetical protein